MKKSLRFYFALFFAKCTARILKLIGRKGTSMPGSWAIILCPDFLGRIPRPKTVVMVAGTNGKTTVCNLTEDILTDNHVEYVCNRFGANVNTGIASALIADSTFFGNPKHDLAVFEFDERSAEKILSYIQPDYFVCTNLCRDALDRNANVEFIADLLNKNLNDSATLILNGDDLITSHLKPQNPRVYFGIDKLPRDDAARSNLVRDITACPQCGAPLSYRFLRYNHIGRAHCPNCDYGSPNIDYEAKTVDQTAMRFTLLVPQGEETYRLLGKNITDLYNELTAVTLLKTLGLSQKQIASSLEKTELTRTRYDIQSASDKEIVLCLAKGQSPIASSRVFEFIAEQNIPCAVVLMNYDRHDAAHSSENTAWLYEADYEFLNTDCVRELITVGSRCYDYQVRALLAGIPQENIRCAEKPENTAALVNFKNVKRVYILHAVFTRAAAEQLRDCLIERAKKETANEN